MNLRVLILSLTLPFLASIILSCNSNKQEVEEQPVQLDSETLRDFARAENPENPYDDFGKHHYLGIKYVQGNLSKERSSDAEAIIDCTHKYVSQLPEESFLRDGTKNPISKEKLEEIYRQEKSGASFLLAEDASPELRKKADELKRVLTVIQNQSIAHPKDRGMLVESLTGNIKTFEQGVLNSDDLSSQDKEILLKATSTGRYSAVQWDSKVLMTSSEKEKLNVLDWLIVIGSDIVGAFVSHSLDGAVAASKFAYEKIKEQKADKPSTDENGKEQETTKEQDTLTSENEH